MTKSEKIKTFKKVLKYLIQTFPQKAFFKSSISLNFIQYLLFLNSKYKITGINKSKAKNSGFLKNCHKIVIISLI
ncbi:TPA: hypothetical protein DEG21_05135 [Patescibacteria group bacterium]|nr:hypothetical protein [Candidatus Gracilibacteria bacterium]HBY75214.1 hypothetical protein [Candidatus Gracilibacteria bacterium]